MENYKIKPLSTQQILISIDRLTRFKNTEAKYLRVYRDIILSNLIYPKYKKYELNEKNYCELTNIAEKIINFSLETLGIHSDNDFLINQRLFDYENTIFNLCDEVQELLKNKINYKGVTTLIDESAPLNLKWLKTLKTSVDLKKSREENSLRFPIEKIVITEGITEEILLPEFAKLCGLDFAKNGIHLISAGGKNQVVKLFYQFCESIKIPVFILLDNDAKENLEEINPRLRAIDKVHLLKNGEFEDIIPLPLIQKTLNYALKNISMVSLENLQHDIPMVKILEELFKNRGMHEFKKAEFANLVRANISGDDDISEEIKEIVKEIKNTLVLTNSEN